MLKVKYKKSYYTFSPRKGNKTFGYFTFGHEKKITERSMSKQKLELTWIGKDKQPVLEPRIRIHSLSIYQINIDSYIL